MGDLLSCSEIGNILSQQICSKLQPVDIQALAQTCHALRQLVLEQLPDSTWTAIAASALPPAHPLLSLPGSAVRSCLERIARAKLVLPEPTSIGICKGDLSLFNRESAVNFAVNHEGTQVLSRKGDSITVFDLILDNSPASLTPICTFQPEAINEDDVISAAVAFTWARDDSFAAIQFEINNPNDPRLAFWGTEYVDVLYLYKAGSQTLHRVTHTHDRAYMCAPQFSLSGQQLIVTWQMDLDEEHALLEFYSTTDTALLTSLHAPIVGAYRNDCTITFQPNGPHFAVPRPDGFVLFDSDSYEMHVHMSPGGAGDGVVRIEFSPDSTQLIRFHVHSSVPALEVFDMTSRSYMKRICQAPYSRLSSAGSNRHLFAGCNSLVVGAGEHLEVLSMHSKPFGTKLQTLDDVQAFAVSPDGVLLASMINSETYGPAGQKGRSHVLHIHQMATGNLLHTYQAEGWAIFGRGVRRPCAPQTSVVRRMQTSLYGIYDQLFVSLSWASSGLRLFVGCCKESNLVRADPASDALTDIQVESLLVFSFT